MRATLCIPLVFACSALADDAGDRAAIDRVVAGLNEVPRRAALFTEDSDAPAELQRLPKVAPVEFRLRKAVEGSASPAGADGPTVTISHDPWGEATIDFPGRAQPLESVNPRIARSAIRWITPDIALADGSWTYRNSGGATQRIPLFFVMKREGGNWKIAALRRLAPR